MLHLRPPRLEDLPSIEALLLRAELPPAGLRDQFPGAYVLAEEDSTLLGLAGLERYGRVGLLRSVAVEPRARARGVGRALVEERDGWARGAGLQAVYLLTLGAAGYFPRLGFSVLARRLAPAEIVASPQFSEICPASAICMVWRPR
jgi:N-acetylglutamate synthase-like GNAT family acetyltransferase